MKSNPNKKGFTLVEILVAVAIIVTIVSMVYGSYFAASKSTQAYRTKITSFQQGRKMLKQMARQISCAYAGYFNGNPDDPDEKILHLVTTSSFWATQDSTDGLFEVIYKFDKSRGLLSLSQERFTGASENITDKRNWHPIARNINHIELEFLNGQQWLHKWDFEAKRVLPSAVRISITCEDENHRQYNHSTAAYIYCRELKQKAQTDTIVSNDKQ